MQLPITKATGSAVQRAPPTYARTENCLSYSKKIGIFVRGKNSTIRLELNYPSNFMNSPRILGNESFSLSIDLDAVMVTVYESSRWKSMSAWNGNV